MELLKTMSSKYKTLWVLLDFALITSGIFFLVPWGFSQWKGVGFRLESWADVSTHEGNAYFAVIMMGIAIAVYGIFDLLIFKRLKR